jgi:O-antigen/teichoic acid export membrane protein
MIKYIKEIGKHSAIYTISTFLTRATGIILIPIYTRYLSTSDYGIISNITALINLFIVILTFGLRSSWSRFFFDYKDRSNEQKSFLGTLFIFLFISGFIINLLLSLFGKGLFHTIIPDLDFYPFIVIALWTAFTGIFFRLKIDLFRVRKQSIQFGIFSFGRFLITVTLTIIAIVYLGYGAIGKVGSEFFSWSFFCIISVYFLCKDIKFEINWEKLKKALKYGLPTLPHSLSGVIVGLADRLFLTNLRGLGAVGIYTIGFQFGSIMNLITYSINLSWFPFFMNLAKEKGDEAKVIFAKLTTYYAIVIFFLGLVISLFSKEMVLLFTTKYYYDAAYIIPIFVFSYVLNGFYYIFSTKVFYVKRAVKYLPLATLSSAGINIILNYFMIDAYGMHGAAWVRFISSLLTVVITYRISQIFYPINYEYKRILVLTLITGSLIVVYLLVQYINIFSLWYFILLKIFIMIIYVLLLFLTHFFKPAEIANMKAIYTRHREKFLRR